MDEEHFLERRSAEIGIKKKNAGRAGANLHKILKMSDN